MNAQDKQIYEQLDGQGKALFALLRKHIDKRFEELNSNIASMDALIVTITSSKTFQKIIADELEKKTKEQENESTSESSGNGNS